MQDVRSTKRYILNYFNQCPVFTKFSANIAEQHSSPSQAVLESINSRKMLFHYIPICPAVSEEGSISERQSICYVENHIDGTRWRILQMQLTYR
jgi:hypothetical protein